MHKLIKYRNTLDPSKEIVYIDKVFESMYTEGYSDYTTELVEEVTLYFEDRNAVNIKINKLDQLISAFKTDAKYISIRTDKNNVLIIERDLIPKINDEVYEVYNVKCS